MAVSDHGSSDPQVHTAAVADKLQSLIEHLRGDVAEVATHVRRPCSKPPRKYLAGCAPLSSTTGRRTSRHGLGDPRATPYNLRSRYRFTMLR